MNHVWSYRKRPVKKAEHYDLYMENMLWQYFTVILMYRDGGDEKDEAYLKMYDGHDWKGFCVRLSYMNME